MVLSLSTLYSILPLVPSPFLRSALRDAAALQQRLLAVESELLEVRFEHEACAGNEARWQRRLLDWQVYSAGECLGLMRRTGRVSESSRVEGREETEQQY
jgi:hypothetical protein